MCPNFGTPKKIKFPFGTNGNLIIFRCPNTYAHYSNVCHSGPSFSKLTTLLVNRRLKSQCREKKRDF